MPFNGWGKYASKPSEARFYFFSSVIVVVIAVLTLLILSKMHVSEGQIANVMTLIIGFSVIVTSNYKTQSSLDLSMEQAKLIVLQTKLQTAKVTDSINFSTEKVTNTMNENAEAITVRAEKVEQTLKETNIIQEVKLNEIKTTAEEAKSIGNAVHILVNNQMTIALRTNMELARELYHKDPTSEHAKLLENATEALEEHNKAESQVKELNEKNKQEGGPDVEALKEDYEEGQS